MKFLSLYEGKQIGSVYSAAMTFTVQEPFNEQHFGHVGTLQQTNTSMCLIDFANCDLIMIKSIASKVKNDATMFLLHSHAYP